MLIGATVGFADAMILIPLMSLLINIQTAILLSGYWGILLSTINFIKYRKAVDSVYFKRMLILGIPGVILGSLLINILETKWIQFALGCFILAYAIPRLILLLRLPRIAHPDVSCQNPLSFEQSPNLEQIVNPYSLLLTGGFIYGFLGGLISASGPVNAIILEKTHHEREQFIGNFNAIGLFLSIIKLGVYTANGLFPIDLLDLYLIGFPIIILACWCGHRLTSHISKSTFTKIVLGLLIIMGFRTALLTFI